MNRKTLEGWIKEAMTDLDKEGPLTQLSLVHVVGTGEEEVHTTKLGQGRDWSAKDLAKMFRGKAETAAQDDSGLQVFRMLAFFNGQDEPQSRFKFVVPGMQDDHHGVTEPPTKEGLRMQDMRITEGVVKMAMQMQQTATNTLLSIITTMGERQTVLERENIDAIELAKKLILETASQRTDAQLQLEKYKRGTVMQDKLLKMVPPLVNTVSGKEIFPQAVEDTAIIDSIAESLTEEQITQLAAILSPEQMGILARRIRKTLEAKRNAHETALALPSEVEEDAAEADSEVAAQ